MGRRTAGLVAGALLLSACGGGDGNSVAGDIAGVATSLDATTSHYALVPAGSDGAFTGDRDVVVGDEVRTDATGFARVRYADGSLTRLDRDTTLTIVSLGTDADPADTSVDLEVGRVWNRVRSQPDGAGRFEVETAVGTAAVRGTAFVVDCLVPGCTFTVLEGEVQVRAGVVPITLGEFQQLTVDVEGGPRAVVDLDPAVLLADPWVERNVALDIDEGFAVIAPGGAGGVEDGAGGGGGGGAGPIDDAGGQAGPPGPDGDPIEVGSTVVYSQQREISVIGTDGQRQVILPSTGAELMAKWLPDGTIGYVRQVERQWQLWRVQPDGSGSSLIVAPESSLSYFSVNDAGDIAWEGRLADGRPRIAVAHLDNTSPRFVVEDLTLHAPEISPDGATLLLWSSSPPELGYLDLASGQVDRQAVPGIRGATQWHPAGTHVLYTVGTEQGPAIVVAARGFGGGAPEQYLGYLEGDFTPDGTGIIATRIDQTGAVDALVHIDRATGEVTVIGQTSNAYGPDVFFGA